MAATGKRKILTLDDRVDVLKRIDNGESCRSIAAVGSVNCGKTQISRIRNDRAAIMKDAASKLHELVEAHGLRQAATASQNKMHDFFI